MKSLIEYLVQAIIAIVIVVPTLPLKLLSMIWYWEYNFDDYWDSAIELADSITHFNNL